MRSAPKPDNEKERLLDLDSLDILDTDLEASFDAITALAANICEVPIALISLVDEDRQWFKSRFGLSAAETPREVAFCAHAIHQDSIFEIEDSRQDERFMDNPLVTGEPHVIFYAGKPLKVREGVKLGTLCVIDNKPKNLSKKQRESLELLSSQVEYLFRMRLAYKTIKNLLTSKSDLLATMSHEIRTPLAAMIGNIEMLEEKDADEEDAAIVAALKNAGTSLLQIVNDILDYSKLDIDKLKLRVQKVDLRKTILDAVSLFEANAKEKGIELICQVDKSCHLEALCDDMRLKQVLHNILSNGIKFTDSGYVKLFAKAIKGKEKDSWQVEIAIEDTGSGMTERTKQRIFHAYEQGAEHKKEGTGLGMMISHKIINLMKGSLKVESRLGEGSLFLVSFPVLEAEKSKKKGGAQSA